MSAANDQPILQRYSDLLVACNENREYFVKPKTEVDRKLGQCLERLAGDVETVQKSISRINCFAHEYDFGPDVPGNGYRSLVNVTNTCIDHILELCRGLTRYRAAAVLSYKSWYLREIEAHAALLHSISSCLKYVEIMREWSEPGDLFTSSIHSSFDLFAKEGLVNQLSFYGRCLGFQYCKSIQRALRIISIAMAGFSESYSSQSNLISKTLISAWNGGKYFLQPELRAKRIVSLVQSTDVHFCKAFWLLAEGEVMRRLPALMGPWIQVNRVINIPPEPLAAIHLQSDTSIDILIPISHFGPAPISARLLSMKRRKGMIGEFGHRSGHSPSDSLIIHCHGGGFVATSSKSHEIYLRDWAKGLDTPILSIDYSLAPQAPYPRALEEVFYSYCWALNNCHLLGWTGKRIVLIGDSAGANLILGTTLKAIQLGVRIPDGLFLAYCPLLVSNVPSPARILSLMDPLLPFGFLISCLRSYVAPNATVQKENAKVAHQRQEIVKASWKSAKCKENLSNGLCKTIENNSDCNVAKTLIPELSPPQFLTNHHDDDDDNSQRMTATLKEIPPEAEADAEFLKNPTDELNFEIPNDPFMSPYLASDEDLKRLPCIKMVSVEMDPCLDDCVMFAKRIKLLNVPITLDILKGLPHGFLNLVKASKEADEGALVCQQRIKELLEEKA